VRGKFLTHALGPEFVDVIGYAGNSVFALGLGAKKLPMSFAILTRCSALP